MLVKELAEETSRIIEMAWEDRTPFDAIERLYGLNESAVIILMRQHLKPKSFNLALRSFDFGRAYCPSQYKQR